MEQSPTVQVLKSSPDPQAQELARRLAGKVRVAPDGCEVWIGGLAGNGQPSLKVQGRQMAVPRLAWELTHPGADVGVVSIYRSCGNRRCIALAHLRDRRDVRSATWWLPIFDALVADGYGCLPWPGRRTKQGYGLLHVDGATVLAHRWWWEQKRGPIPAGQVLMRTCARPDCVSLDHLTVGRRSVSR